MCVKMAGSLLNVSAIFISLASLATSTLLAARQARSADRANQLPIIIEMLDRHTTQSFYLKEEKIWEELPSRDPNLGVTRLPADIRGEVIEVSFFYQMLGYLLAFEVVDENVVILPIRYRLEKTWTAIRPFVESERVLRGDPYSYLNTLEEFAKSAAKKDVEGMTIMVQKRLSRIG